MSLTVELPEDVLRRLEATARARGLTIEQLATETLSRVPGVDHEFAEMVNDTIVEHREILDRLADS